MGPKFCDFSTTADQVTCFSNSASFLTVLAPGSEITAAGITMSGTSQATPHVAGAIAVLREKNAALIPDQIEDILRSTGVSVTDSRNGLAFPRLDVLAAVDAAVNGGPSSSVLFQDDMENGRNEWNPQAKSWGQTTSDSYSPSHAWTDSPAGNYPNRANVSLHSPEIALPSSGAISLSFWHRYDLEKFFDYANVWVTTDNGATYTWLWSFTGNSRRWVHESADLSDFRGQSIRIVFQVLTDKTVTADGWYIDDMVVTTHE
jgi:subtilisin family serine protease